MNGKLNRGINYIELANNIKEDGESVKINKNYIEKLKNETTHEEVIGYLCIATLEIYGLEDETERLKEENKKYNKWIESLNKDNHRLNNIIKEAIEYIEQVGIYSDYGDPGIQSENDLLKILKGE